MSVQNETKVLDRNVKKSSLFNNLSSLLSSLFPSIRLFRIHVHFYVCISFSLFVSRFHFLVEYSRSSPAISLKLLAIKEQNNSLEVK